jgi:hypothetical protein
MASKKTSSTAKKKINNKVVKKVTPRPKPISNVGGGQGGILGAFGGVNGR